MIHVSQSPRSGLINTDKLLGWISTLKETFGFIETADHASEIFFHFSEFLNTQEKFNINTPVTYYRGVKGKLILIICVTSKKMLRLVMHFRKSMGVGVGRATGFFASPAAR